MAKCWQIQCLLTAGAYCVLNIICMCVTVCWAISCVCATACACVWWNVYIMYVCADQHVYVCHWMCWTNLNCISACYWVEQHHLHVSLCVDEHLQVDSICFTACDEHYNINTCANTCVKHYLHVCLLLCCSAPR